MMKQILFHLLKGVWTFRYDKISCHTKLRVKMTNVTLISIRADILQRTLHRILTCWQCTLLIPDRRSRLMEMSRGDDGLCAVLQFVMVITFFLTLYICGALETKSCPLASSCLSECNNLRSAELILIKSDIGESTFGKRLNFFGRVLKHCTLKHCTLINCYWNE